MKKKIVLAAIVLSALMAGCSNKAADSSAPAEAEAEVKQEEAEPEKEDAAGDAAAAGESAGIANPWTATDREGILQSLGFSMDAPEGAKNVSYQMNESEGLGEMSFSYGEPELEYTYRMKAAVEFEDISGLNYNWSLEESGAVSYCDAKLYRTNSDGKTIDLCLWFDAAPGMMYSLSTSDEDLDGFDITAIADQIFVPTQGDAGVEAPSNFLEAKLQRYSFDSYDEIISLLDKGNAYAKVKIYGYDDELLVIAEGAYDNLDGNMAAIEASVYRYNDGKAVNVGNIYSSGTAYPISMDSEGKVYSGGNHEVSVECISAESSAVMSLIYAYESFDESGNATYGGFVRDNNSLENDGKDIAEDDPSVLQGLYEEFQKATPINYTVVE